MNLKPFNKSFFLEPTLEIAPRLLGSYFWSNVDKKKTVGKIVEVEAYLGSNDPACHASHGKTLRNADMFLTGGVSYVYLIYGMYFCMNVVTEKEGIGAAVLIRGIEPLEGENIMLKRRGNHNLTNGPGRLCDAFGVSKKHSGICLCTSKLIGLYKGDIIPASKISTSSRIGISSGKDLSYRYYISGNKWVSKEKV